MYQLIETPYFVDTQISNLTKPCHLTNSFVLSNGRFNLQNQELVGSAEQGFIALLLENKLNADEKYQSITPCFREEHIDDTHQLFFMKLELIHISGKMIDLMSICDHALNFYKSITNESICLEQITDSSFDIIKYSTKKQKWLEIGSYGIRTINVNNIDYKFIYGTGLALPRFSM